MSAKIITGKAKNLKWCIEALNNAAQALLGAGFALMALGLAKEAKNVFALANRTIEIAEQLTPTNPKKAA